MDATAWIAAVSAVVALGALYFTWEQARNAKRQTDLQQRMHEDAAQPYVWADIRPDEEHGFVLVLVARNEGRTVATDVRLTFDKPLPSEFADEWDGRALSLASIAPGRQLVWWLKPGPAWYGSDLPRAYTVTIDCTGPFGPAPTLSYVLNIDDFGSEAPMKRGSLHALTKELKAMTQVLKKK
jgi:hypothetical protein